MSEKLVPTTLRIAVFRLALSRITQHYPPDTIAGRLAADALAKHPNQFENADRENDCEPFSVPEIEGLRHGPGDPQRRELPLDAIDRLEKDLSRAGGLGPQIVSADEAIVEKADLRSVLTALKAPQP